MEEKAIIRNEKKMSDMALFWVCMFLTLGVGLTVAYCSGLLNGAAHLQKPPFIVYDWVIIALPPVLFFHQALALFLTLKQNVYTENGRSVRTWTVVFQVALLLMLAFLPYFVWGDMPVASYIVSTLTTATALGATILTYRQTKAGGAVMTVLFLVTAVIMIYLGYWAFA